MTALWEISLRGAWPGFQLEIARESAATGILLNGPSGAGKSSLLRALAGLERRLVGTIRFRGETWQGKCYRGAWERRIGYVPQECTLIPNCDVLANLRLGGGTEEEASALAERLEIGPLLKRMPRHLSGGERQRVAIGRALLRSPQVLLLDEPFSALHRPLRARVGALLQEFCEERKIPWILASHEEGLPTLLVNETWSL